MDSSNTYSVSSLFAELKDMLQDQYPMEVQVSGELGDFTAAASGHWYFDLKDEHAQLHCVMFKGANNSILSPPQEGSVLTLIGRPSFYRDKGKFQLITNQMIVGGQGDLQRSFDRLKKKLHSEGLFAEERKQPIPEFINHLGLITSEQGAAVHDVLKVLARRMPMMKITLFPVMVQGDEAPAQLITALEMANRHAGLDAVLITRGGGSLEDLWCFNDENLVRAIAASERPVVTAIGHEVDYTLADFAADRRSATPSAAAEELSISSTDWLQWLDDLVPRLKRNMDDTIHDRMQECDDLYRRYLRHDPFKAFAVRLTGLQHRLQETMQYHRLNVRNTIISLQNQLLALAPHRQQQQRALQLKELSLRLHHSGSSLVKHHQDQLGHYDRELRAKQQSHISSLVHRLNRWEKVIKALSPVAVLSRGYALVTDKQGRIVKTTETVKVQDLINLRLAKGKLAARVEDIYDSRQQNLDLLDD